MINPSGGRNGLRGDPAPPRGEDDHERWTCLPQLADRPFRPARLHFDRVGRIAPGIGPGLQSRPGPTETPSQDTLAARTDTGRFHSRYKSDVSTMGGINFRDPVQISATQQTLAAQKIKESLFRQDLLEPDGEAERDRVAIDQVKNLDDENVFDHGPVFLSDDRTIDSDDRQIRQDNKDDFSISASRHVDTVVHQEANWKNAHGDVKIDTQDWTNWREDANKDLDRFQTRKTGRTSQIDVNDTTLAMNLSPEQPPLISDRHLRVANKHLGLVYAPLEQPWDKGEPTGVDRHRDTDFSDLGYMPPDLYIDRDTANRELNTRTFRLRQDFTRVETTRERKDLTPVRYQSWAFNETEVDFRVVQDISDPPTKLAKAIQHSYALENSPSVVREQQGEVAQKRPPMLIGQERDAFTEPQQPIPYDKRVEGFQRISEMRHFADAAEAPQGDPELNWRTKPLPSDLDPEGSYHLDHPFDVTSHYRKRTVATGVDEGPGITSTTRHTSRTGQRAPEIVEPNTKSKKITENSVYGRNDPRIQEVVNLVEHHDTFGSRRSARLEPQLQQVQGMVEHQRLSTMRNVIEERGLALDRVVNDWGRG